MSTIKCHSTSCHSHHWVSMPGSCIGGFESVTVETLSQLSIDILDDDEPWSFIKFRLKCWFTQHFCNIFTKECVEWNLLYACIMWIYTLGTKHWEKTSRPQAMRPPEEKDGVLSNYSRINSVKLQEYDVKPLIFEFPRFKGVCARHATLRFYLPLPLCKTRVQKTLAHTQAHHEVHVRALRPDNEANNVL